MIVIIPIKGHYSLFVIRLQQVKYELQTYTTVTILDLH